MTSRDVFEQILHFCNSNDQIYLYGKGNLGKSMWAFLEDNGIHIAGFIVTKNLEKTTEIYNHAGHMAPVYEKEEFLRRNGNGGVIFSMSEKHQAELDLSDFQRWECLRLKDYQLNELGFYEYIKITGKCRRISFFRTAITQKVEKFLENMRLRKYAHLGKQIDPWHLIPKYKKPYVKDIVSSILKLPIKQDGSIVECGCGLCDILGSNKLKKYKRYGFDVDENVIYVDRKQFQNIEFAAGSFDKIQHMNISVLIAVNFLQILPEDEVRAAFREVFTKNRIQFFILDEVTGLYKFLHRFDSILPSGCTLVKTLGPYASWGGVRYIKVFDTSNASAI